MKASSVKPISRILQLSLTAELSVAPLRSAAPAMAGTTVNKIPSSILYMAVVALLRGPQPYRHLARLIAPIDGDALLLCLYGLGFNLPCYQVPVSDAESDVETVYTLTPADIRLAKRWLAQQGEAHG